MLKLLEIIILVCNFLIAGIIGQKMLGAGKWSVLTVSGCEAAEPPLPWPLDARRRRLNRTHDAISADIQLDADLDQSYAIRIDVCKMVDGGCKPYMTLADDCLIDFVKKHSAANVRTALGAAGLDPPDFPIPKGEFHLKDFVMDPDGMPKDGLYGEYVALGYVVKDGRDMACVRGSVKYEPADDDGSAGAPFG